MVICCWSIEETAMPQAATSMAQRGWRSSREGPGRRSRCRGWRRGYRRDGAMTSSITFFLISPFLVADQFCSGVRSMARETHAVKNQNILLAKSIWRRSTFLVRFPLFLVWQRLIRHPVPSFFRLATPPRSLLPVQNDKFGI